MTDEHLPAAGPGGRNSRSSAGVAGMTVAAMAPPRSNRTPAAPRWVRRVALISALCPVASSLWRLPMIVGLPMGLPAEAIDDLMTEPLWLRACYLIGLGVLTDDCALMTLGLVRWWGETYPRWIPLVGGHPVRTWLAATLGVAGGLGATAFALQLALTWNTQIDTWDTWACLITACYAPLLLWGPTVLVVTTDFVRRRRLRAAMPAVLADGPDRRDQ